MTDEELPTGSAGRGRLALLTAMDAALHRHVEVSAAVAASADRGEAVAAIRQLLTVTAGPAEWVLEMNWRWLTVQGVQSVADDVAAQAAALDVLVSPHQAWTDPDPVLR